jgi:hypothetical protein
VFEKMEKGVALMWRYAEAERGELGIDRLDEAKQLRCNNEVMEARKKKLGDDHPDTLTSMANLR